MLKEDRIETVCKKNGKYCKLGRGRRKKQKRGFLEEHRKLNNKYTIVN